MKGTVPFASRGLLEASAYLHDTGHFISSTRHHHHSQYLVASSDLPGFDRDQRLFVANLCRYHRKSTPKPSHENFRALDSEQQDSLLRTIPLLRIADNLDRSHRQAVESVKADIRPDEIVLTLRSQGDAALEQWAAAQHGDVFLQVYGKRLVVQT